MALVPRIIPSANLGMTNRNIKLETKVTYRVNNRFVDVVYNLDGIRAVVQACEEGFKDAHFGRNLQLIGEKQGQLVQPVTTAADVKHDLK